MDTNEPTCFPAELRAQLQEVLANLAGGIRDPEKARLACEHMDRLREENRRLFGEQDIAVALIRQTRGSIG